MSNQTWTPWTQSQSVVIWQGDPFSAGDPELDPYGVMLAWWQAWAIRSGRSNSIAGWR